MLRKTTSYYARKAKKKANFWVKTVGQFVIVRRLYPEGTQTLRCIPMTDDAGQAQLVSEGDDNAANAQPHLFVFEGDTDVRVKDILLYRGSMYRVFRAVADCISGIPIILNCYATRER